MLLTGSQGQLCKKHWDFLHFRLPETKPKGSLKTTPAVL